MLPESIFANLALVGTTANVIRGFIAGIGCEGSRVVGPVCDGRHVSRYGFASLFWETGKPDVAEFKDKCAIVGARLASIGAFCKVFRVVSAVTAVRICRSHDVDIPVSDRFAQILCTSQIREYVVGGFACGKEYAAIRNVI